MTSTVRIATAAITATLSALLIMVGMATTASPAGDQPLEFSADGQRWSAHTAPLFPDTVLVPGEPTTSVLWVRHHGPSAARLSVSLTDHATDPAGAALREWITVTINGHAVTRGTIWHGPAAEPGDAVQARIEITLDPEAPESIRRQSADVLSLLTFREVVAANAPGATDDDRLSTSGAAIVPVLLLAGALALLGAALRRGHR